MGGGSSRINLKPIDRYLDEARTGDVVLFSSDNCEIKFFTGSRFTHCGVIIRQDDFADALVKKTAERVTLSSRSSPIYLLHSMNKGANPRDLLSGQKNKEGPQLQRLEKAIDWWKRNTIYVRQIRFENGKKDVFRGKGEEILAFAREMDSKPYEKSVFEMFAATTGLLENAEDLSSVFCSELVAEFLKRFKVMRTKEPSNEFVPASFTPERQEDLKLAKNVSFSKIYLIHE